MYLRTMSIVLPVGRWGARLLLSATPLCMLRRQRESIPHPGDMQCLPDLAKVLIDGRIYGRHKGGGGGGLRRQHPLREMRLQSIVELASQ